MITGNPPDDTDTHYMAQALALARRGLYTTTPNPRVGCIIVRDGDVLAQGWHAQAGGPHAEAHALSAARERGMDVAGATVFVTLEPCSHQGRTPPCADALIKAGVAQVVSACSDPNPLVAGQGLARLQAAGIRTKTGVLEQDARELNIGFFSRMQRGRPWVRLKAAISLDGFVALPDNESQWITGEAARLDGHHWRARACAILTGIGTVRADNPLLNVRGVDTPRQPVRVIVDSHLDIALDARTLDSNHSGGPVWIAHAVDGLEPRSPGIDIRHPPSDLQHKADALRQAGVELICLPNASGKVDLTALLQTLGQRGINELHIEAGSKLNGSLIREGCVDELLIYQAPRLLGQGLSLAALPAPASLAGTWDWTRHTVDTFGQDIRLLLRRLPATSTTSA